MKNESDRDKKKPTPIQVKQRPEATTESAAVHHEQAMKTALEIALQKAREINKKYSE